jgi:predicted dithiol-disulfide oxidoreductase (DUF899 family)
MRAIRFPGESPDYRKARDELLEAEADLRRRIEEVAALRRRLPLGGEVPEDYLFEEGPPDLERPEGARTVRLSELFEGGKDSLVLYGFMFGPRMERPCPMCTSLLDGLDGIAPHAGQRLNLAVVARSPIARMGGFARGRGWRHLRLLSSAGNSYNRDYHAESPEGGQLPSLNVFVRRAGRVRHSYNAELLFAPSEAGQDPRHVDLLWPLWQLLDLTPEGRGADWYPRLDYRK